MANSGQKYEEFVSPCEPLSDRVFEVKLQKRIIVAVSHKNESEPFSRVLPTFLDNIEGINENWLIESINPLPLLTRIEDDSVAVALNQILSEVSNYEPGVRVVAALGTVEFGLSGGQKTRFSVGSSGAVVCDVVSGCYKLPMNSSWVDEYVCKVCKLNPRSETKLNDRTFFEIG
jgi:hypothetical protein